MKTRIINSLTITICSIFLLFNCTPAQEDNSAEIEEGISEANSKFMAAVAEGDTAKIATFYTEDGQFMAPNSEIITGKAGIQNYIQSSLDAGITGINLETLEVEGAGDTAWEVGQYTLFGENDQEIDRGKYIVIWKKVGEEWKLHRDIFNSSMPLPSNEEEDSVESEEEETEDDAEEEEESA